MHVKYSIIIPAYQNVKPLLLTLTSLEIQTFPKERFEVVVVNDGADADIDKALKTYNPPYTLKYIKNKTRLGRAFTRNAGAKNSVGRYLVFLDADFIVIPEFLDVLNGYFKTYPSHVISGFPESLHAAYTHYYPHFSDRTKMKMRQLLEPKGLWSDSWTRSNSIRDVLSPDDLRQDFNKIRQTALPYRLSETDYTEYKSTDVAPWLLFVTRCVALKRSQFMKTGGFEARFVNYGVEDWELGYRLHKAGVPFCSMDRLVGYHQEHPSITRQDDPKLDNLRILYHIHGSSDPELSLFTVCHPWRRLSLYKTVLRTLAALNRYPETAQLARVMEKTIQLSAISFSARK